MATSHSHHPTSTVLDRYEAARVEAATASTSLSPESARLVRIERIIAGQPNPADRARAQGFYDFMLGRPSLAKAQGPRLEVSYDQGWAKGAQRRALLNGKAWYETEKERAGGKWSWRVFREGYFQADGSARSEAQVDQEIEDTKADLMDRYGDWGNRYARSAADDPGEAEAESAPRM